MLFTLHYGGPLDIKHAHIVLINNKNADDVKSLSTFPTFLLTLISLQFDAFFKNLMMLLRRDHYIVLVVVNTLTFTTVLC